jgi:ABC-type uncharacterized transport system involved in gliding motility auxiliary subunit
MTASSLKRYAPWAAALGIGGWVVAASAALIYRQFNTVVQVSLVVGLLGFVLAILFNPGAITEWAGGRQARYGTNSVVMSLALIGIVVLANYLIQRVPGPNRVFDWSEDKSNTLAQESVEALKNVPQPVKAIGFYGPDFRSQQDSAEDLLNRFKDQAPDKFSYEFVDPYTDPVRARTYEISRDGTLILEMGEKRQEVSFASESEITSALVGFSATTSRTVYFLGGHGERPTEAGNPDAVATVVDLLKNQNYEIRPLSLAATDTVPSDARAVVIAGPQLPFTTTEVALIQQYLDRGNSSLIVLLDPPAEVVGDQPAPADPLLDYLSTAWGVTARNDLIVDPVRSIQNQPFWPVESSYGASPITSRMEGFDVFFPLARSLEYTTTAAGLTPTPLVLLSEQSWGETDIAALSQNILQPDGADAQGSLAVAVSVENATIKSRLVVFGDSTFASDQMANQFGNGKLFVNSVNWATNDETLINLTPKIPPQRQLKLIDAVTGYAIFFVVVIAMPVLVLVSGGIVWFMRRRKI